MRIFAVLNNDNATADFVGCFSSKIKALRYIAAQRKKNQVNFQIFETLVDYNNYVLQTKVKNI